MDPVVAVLGLAFLAAAVFGLTQAQRANAANGRSTRLLGEVTELRDTSDGYRRELEALRQDRDKLTRSIDAQRKKKRGDSKRADTFQAQNDTLTKQLEAANRKVSDANDRAAEYKARMQAVEAQLARLDRGVAVATPPAAEEPAQEGATQSGETDETGDSTPAGDLSAQVEKLTRSLERERERQERAEKKAKVANDRFRDTFKKLNVSERELRRSLRQEGDHRQMVDVLKDRLQLAADLLFKLEQDHGVLLPDEVTGGLRRRSAEEAIDAAEAEEEAERARRRANRRRKKAEQVPARGPAATTVEAPGELGAPSAEPAGEGGDSPQDAAALAVEASDSAVVEDSVPSQDGDGGAQPTETETSGGGGSEGDAEANEAAAPEAEVAAPASGEVDEAKPPESAPEVVAPGGAASQAADEGESSEEDTAEPDSDGVASDSDATSSAKAPDEPAS